MHQYRGTVRRDELAHAPEARLLVAADRTGVQRRWISLHPRDARVCEQLGDERAHHSSPETLPELCGVGEKLIDAEHAGVGHLQPPPIRVARHRLVRLDVTDRLAIEHRESLAQANFEGDRSIPPFRHVRPCQPARDQRQIGCGQRPEMHRARAYAASTIYYAARVAATGSLRAAARLLSMLKAPAPLPKTISSPPAMARFLRKLAISICCCAAGTAQKLWNTSVTGTRKMSSASAPQRVLKPTTTETAPNNSRAVAIASRISGTPLLPAYATIPRQPASFPSPLTTKIVPSATRPTNCAHLEMTSMCSSVLVTHSTAARGTRAASAARGELACGRPAGNIARSEPRPPPGAQ